MQYIMAVVVAVIAGIILLTVEYDYFKDDKPHLPVQVGGSKLPDAAKRAASAAATAAKEARQLEAKRADEENERLLKEERKRLDDLRKQIEDDRQKDEARRQAEDRRRDAERQRLEAQQREMLESQRRQTLQSAQCRDPGNGQYTCCPLGQTPELRVAPVGSGREWDIYCRSIGLQ